MAPWEGRRTDGAWGDYDAGQIVFDAAGTPSGITPGHHASTLLDRPVGDPGGRYEMTWEGNGELWLSQVDVKEWGTKRVVVEFDPRTRATAAPLHVGEHRRERPVPEPPDPPRVVR